MANQVRLYDRDHNLLGIASIDSHADHCAGVIDTAGMPATARWTFDRYEKLVNDQVFSMLDVVEHEIAKMGIVSVTDDGVITALEDVKLLPRARKVSFKEAVQLTFPGLE